MSPLQIDGQRPASCLAVLLTLAAIVGIVLFIACAAAAISEALR